MKFLLQILLVLFFLIDMLSTEYAIPDLQNESNVLVQLFRLKINDLWVLSFFQASLHVLLIQFFFNFIKSRLYNNSFILNSKNLIFTFYDFNNWLKIFLNGFLFFSFSLPIVTVYFKFFAVIRNFFYGVNRWKTFVHYPKFQLFSEQSNDFIQKNYDDLSWVIFQNQYMPLIYFVLLFYYVKKQYVSFIFK